MKTKETQKLDTSIKEYLNRNTLFGMYGIVNLTTLRISTGTELSNEELKEQINVEYSKEFIPSKIEYLEKPKLVLTTG